MSELSVFVEHMKMSSHAFRTIEPRFCRLLIETVGEGGEEDLVKIFLAIEDSERLSAAVKAFNEAWDRDDDNGNEPG